MNVGEFQKAALGNIHRTGEALFGDVMSHTALQYLLFCMLHQLVLQKPADIFKVKMSYCTNTVTKLFV